MLHRPVYLLLVLILFVNIDEVKPKIEVTARIFSDLRLILDTARNLYRILKEGPKMVNEVFAWLADGDAHESKVVNPKLTDILSKLDSIDMRMETGFAAIEGMISQVPPTIEVDSIKRDLALPIRKIKEFYDMAMTYSRNISRYNKIELQNVAHTLAGKKSGGLEDSLSTVYRYIVPQYAENVKKSFLDLLNNRVQVIHHCNKSQKLRVILSNETAHSINLYFVQWHSKASSRS